jgi:hypothetical protein
MLENMSNSESERHYWVNRTLCDVLYDAKEYIKTLNLTKDQKSLLQSLVSEAQVMGNRMEAGLGDNKDLEKLNEEWHTLRREVKDLRKEKKELTKDG